MLELCFNEGVGGLLAYWQSGKQKILCLGDDLSIGPIAGGPVSYTHLRAKPAGNAFSIA